MAERENVGSLSSWGRFGGLRLETALLENEFVAVPAAKLNAMLQTAPQLPTDALETSSLLAESMSRPCEVRAGSGSFYRGVKGGDISCVPSRLPNLLPYQDRLALEDTPVGPRHDDMDNVSEDDDDEDEPYNHALPDFSKNQEDPSDPDLVVASDISTPTAEVTSPDATTEAVKLAESVADDLNAASVDVADAPEAGPGGPTAAAQQAALDAELALNTALLAKTTPTLRGERRRARDSL